MDAAKRYRVDTEKVQKAVAKEFAAKRDKKAISAHWGSGPRPPHGRPDARLSCTGTLDGKRLADGEMIQLPEGDRIATAMKEELS
jgi:hypothetical protein